MEKDLNDKNLSNELNQGENSQNLNEKSDKSEELENNESEEQKEELDYKKLYEETKASNARLLEENIKHKRVRDKAREAQQKAQEEALKAQGNYKELLELSEQKIKSYEEREEQLEIASALAEEAQKRNCSDWDQLYSLGDTSMVEYDRELGVVTGITEFFDKAQKNDRLTKFFIKSKHLETDSDLPSFGNPTGASAIDYRKNPLAYLQASKKVSVEAYNNAVTKLKKEGLIR